MKKNNNKILLKAILSIIFAFVNMISGILIIYLAGSFWGAILAGTSIGLGIIGGRWLAIAENIDARDRFLKSVDTFNSLMIQAIEEQIEQERNEPFKEFKGENSK